MIVALQATREIILSAGAIGSPQILMVSGVGDDKELATLGIERVAHNPAVGKHLQDHVSGGVSALLKEPLTKVQNSPGLNGIAFAGSPADAAIAKEEGYARGPGKKNMACKRPR